MGAQCFHRFQPGFPAALALSRPSSTAPEPWLACPLPHLYMIAMLVPRGHNLVLLVPSGWRCAQSLPVASAPRTSHTASSVLVPPTSRDGSSLSSDHEGEAGLLSPCFPLHLYLGGPPLPSVSANSLRVLTVKKNIVCVFVGGQTFFKAPALLSYRQAFLVQQAFLSSPMWPTF